VNFGGWFSQIDAIEEKDPKGFPGVEEHVRTFLGPDDFRQVKGWGFDHVRLPLDWHNAFGRDLRPKPGILDAFEKAVDGLLQAGLEVILDLHKCPGHDFHDGIRREQTFFTDPAQRKDCLEVWAQLAERFGDRPGVMLEVLNEPVAPSAEVWNEVKDELVGFVRRRAPRSTIVVGSNLWNNASQFAHLTPVEDDNILYSVHLYNPILFTHQKAPWLDDPVFSVSRTYPGTYEVPPGHAGKLPSDLGSWDRKRLSDHLEPVFAFRERHGARVACNEFGVYMGGADTASRMAWMSDVLGLFRENRIGWSYWHYRNLDFGIVSVGESLFADSPQYDNPQRIDQALLALLRQF